MQCFAFQGHKLEDSSGKFILYISCVIVILTPNNIVVLQCMANQLSENFRYPPSVVSVLYIDFPDLLQFLSHHLTRMAGNVCVVFCYHDYQVHWFAFSAAWDSGSCYRVVQWSLGGERLAERGRHWAGTEVDGGEQLTELWLIHLLVQKREKSPHQLQQQYNRL